MQNTVKKSCQLALLLMASLVLSACGNLSKVDEKGMTQDPVWPDPTSVTFKSGAYPNVESLGLVEKGMTKDQLYNLLGRPHFNEGLVGVREWDYWFHFRTPQGDVSCQYKVLFDSDKRAQSFLWKEPSCEKFAQPARSGESRVRG